MQNYPKGLNFKNALEDFYKILNFSKRLNVKVPFYLIDSKQISGFGFGSKTRI